MFPKVPHSGFPLVLSPAGLAAIPPATTPVVPPMVSPPVSSVNASVSRIALTPGSAPACIGISAAPSQADANDPTGARLLVPVATAGLVLAWVLVPAASQATSTSTTTTNNGTTTTNSSSTPSTPTTLPVGTLLSPAPAAESSARWNLVPILPGNRAAYGAIVVAQLASAVTNPAAVDTAQQVWVWVVAPHGAFIDFIDQILGNLV
jgi:hypothetical protein